MAKLDVESKLLIAFSKQSNNQNRDLNRVLGGCCCKIKFHEVEKEKRKAFCKMNFFWFSDIREFAFENPYLASLTTTPRNKQREQVCV